MKQGKFSSESVSVGHPDRLCDTVVNTILTQILNQDPNGHAGLEALVTKNYMVLSGECSYKGDKLDYEQIARQVVAEIGYTYEALGFDCATFEFVDKVNTQSPDIAQGVNLSEDNTVIGAGDQGIMFGYASDETDAYLPLTTLLANALTFRYQEIRRLYPHILSPDAKSQVTYDYDKKQLDTILMAASHTEEATLEQVRDLVIEEVIKPTMHHVFKDSEAFDKAVASGMKVLVNTTGRFVVCGPNSDAGVVGRKLTVDSYGGHAPIGGGCTNGKDPSKVDTSAARASRHAALNVVAAGLCKECLIQLGYAIGVPQPVSISVEATGLAEGISEESIAGWLHNNYDFSVAGIIKNLKLQSSDYSRLTYTGQFGQNSQVFEVLADSTSVQVPTWEKTDLVERLKEDFKLS